MPHLNIKHLGNLLVVFQAKTANTPGTCNTCLTAHKCCAQHSFDIFQKSLPFQRRVYSALHWNRTKYVFVFICFYFNKYLLPPFTIQLNYYAVFVFLAEIWLKKPQTSVMKILKYKQMKAKTILCHSGDTYCMSVWLYFASSRQVYRAKLLMSSTKQDLGSSDKTRLAKRQQIVSISK